MFTKKMWNALKGKLFIITVIIVGGFLLLISKKEKDSKEITVDKASQPTACLSGEEEVKVRVLGPLPADDPGLLSYIRRHHLWPASKLPYNLTNPNLNETSEGQAQMVIKLLNGMRNGFFVECGASSGDYLSNTLTLERKYGWDGLLIEASPKLFPQVLQKRRKVWSSDTCLSSHLYPERTVFVEHGKGGGFLESRLDNSGRNAQGLQCFPLYSMALALNRTKIDYLSLDVEGSEMEVLGSIPYSKLDITVISAEYNQPTVGKGRLKKFMEGVGYRTVGEVNKYFAADVVFIKKNFTSLPTATVKAAAAMKTVSNVRGKP